MSRFLVVNPNTSDEMTQSIEETVRAYLGPNNQADVIRAEIGPRSLESFYEYSLAAVGVIRTLRKINMDKYDGLLLACFGDPGLYGLKETLAIPVIGIAEASISLSLLLGSSFAILCASDKAVPMMKNMVQQYGMNDRCAGILPLGLPVLDLEKDKENTAKILLNTGSEAVAKGAEVLLLGCAGMTGFSDSMEKELKVTVIDPIRSGLKLLECIVECGLNISKCGLYMTPSPKEIIGKDLLA